MTELCCVTIVHRSSSGNRIQFVCAPDSLSDLLGILERDNFVIVYKISIGGYSVTQKAFGWGGYTKWVIEFTQSDYDKC